MSSKDLVFSIGVVSLNDNLILDYMVHSLHKVPRKFAEYSPFVLLDCQLHIVLTLDPQKGNVRAKKLGAGK